MTDERKESMKKYQHEHKETLIEYQKQYIEDNKERLREYRKQYHANKRNDPEYIKARKEYRENNKEAIQKQKNERRKHRKLTDPSYKLIEQLRSRTYKAIKLFSLSKTSKTKQMLGCDHKTLLEWLQISGERWDSNFDITNYSGEEYHIDHMKTFEDVSKGVYTLEEVCHYTNLQILPADINLAKRGTSWVI